MPDRLDLGKSGRNNAERRLVVGRMISDLQADPNLVALLDALAERSYAFMSVTPATHARVLARAPERSGNGLTDIFGWSRPFTRDALDPELLTLLEAAGALEAAPQGRFRSALRVSSYDGLLFLHSAYPTDSESAVFFGPDSFRFAALIENRMPPAGQTARIADYGTGSGIGGIVAGRAAQGEAAHQQARVHLCDVNPAALRLAAANAAHAGIDHTLLSLGDPGELPADLDCIVTHPPFMMDESHRTYRDGGDMLGARLSFDWAMAAAEKLAPGGRFIMHTGSAIAGGNDLLRQALNSAVAERGLVMEYRELEPDYYGEELDTPAYRDAGVERLAMVAVVIDKPAA